MAANDVLSDVFASLRLHGGVKHSPHGRLAVEQPSGLTCLKDEAQQTFP